MNTLSSIVLTSVISAFFAIVSSLITYRVFVYQNENNESLTKENLIDVTKDVIAKWFNSNKINEKLLFLENERKSLLEKTNLIDERIFAVAEDSENLRTFVRSSCDMNASELKDLLNDVSDFKKEIFENVKKIENKMSYLENKISNIKIVFE